MNRENRPVNWLAMNLANELVMSPESKRVIYPVRERLVQR